MSISESGAADAQVGSDVPTPPCSACAEGYVWTGHPKGDEISLGSLNVYLASPSDGTSDTDSKPALVFIHDGFGWKFLNNRLLCDRIAAGTGFHVYMPDFYDGETIVTEEKAQQLMDPQPTVLGQLMQGLRLVVAAPALLMQMQRFSVKRTQPLLDEVILELRKKHGQKSKIGAVGYCWGGKYSLRLGTQGKVSAVVACHPSMVDPNGDSLKDMAAACHFILAEKDFIFPEKLWRETEACIKESGSAVEHVKYEGTTHGFSVRCNEDDLASAKARDDALRRTIEWFSKYLSV